MRASASNKNEAREHQGNESQRFEFCIHAILPISRIADLY